MSLEKDNFLSIYIVNFPDYLDNEEFIVSNGTHNFSSLQMIKNLSDVKFLNLYLNIEISNSI